MYSSLTYTHICLHEQQQQQQTSPLACVLLCKYHPIHMQAGRCTSAQSVFLDTQWHQKNKKNDTIRYAVHIHDKWFVSFGSEFRNNFFGIAASAFMYFCTRLNECYHNIIFTIKTRKVGKEQISRPCNVIGITYIYGYIEGIYTHCIVSTNFFGPGKGICSKSNTSGNGKRIGYCDSHLEQYFCIKLGQWKKEHIYPFNLLFRRKRTRKLLTIHLPSVHHQSKLGCC